MSEELIQSVSAEGAESTPAFAQDGDDSTESAPASAQDSDETAESDPISTENSAENGGSPEADELQPTQQESKPGILALSRPLSPKRIASNRRNARKSTGPRTLAGKARVARNGIRQGRHLREKSSHAQFLAGSMAEMGEDPQQFSRIQQKLIGALRPCGAAQTMLVEDIASLRWERRRLERAQAALLARRMQQLELERQRHSLQVSQQMSADIPGVLLKTGLLWARDSATKFQKILEWLESLKDAMEAGEFSGVETLMGWIYGGNLTLRGAAIKARFEELAQSTPQAGNASDRPASWFTLRRQLLAEICNVTQQYQLYLREHVELTPTMREECLVPTLDQRWLMRQMNLVDRQIHSKTRLLLEMRRAEGEPEEAPVSEDSVPGKGGPDEAV
ncbi:MAG: hypothetical protein ACRD3T_00705 [Terriglobia bacterium]